MIAALVVIAAWWVLVPVAEAGAKRVKPSAKIVTANQSQLLKSGRLAVRVSSSGRTRVSVKVFRGSRGGFFRARTVRLRGKRRQARVVRLKMTPAGRRVLSRCGSQRLRAVSRFRSRGKTRTSRSARTLRRDGRRCRDVVLPNPATVEGCDPIDPSVCMAPFPNDYLTRPDASTPTGLRLDFKAERMPVNKDGKPAWNEAFNRNDGFSPLNNIVTRLPGLDTPEAFRANGIASQLDIGAYSEPDQRVLLLDTVTGQRVPIWAEIDMIPGTPNPHNNNAVQGSVDDRMLTIHPATPLEPGRRYVVVLRNLTDASGEPIPVSEVFGLIRDGVETANPQVEQRRSQLARVFEATDAAGVDRSSLNLAWDFTVASQRNLTERAVVMRDDAFAQLGDSNLANGSIEGVAPEIKNVSQTNYGPCGSEAAPFATNCSGSQQRYALKKVTGTITVPCYLKAPGARNNPGLADVPCASGSEMNYEPGSDLPQQMTDSEGDPVTWDAPFTCTIPRAAPNSPNLATGRKAVVFGHGLLGDNANTEALGRYPAGLTAVSCGTDWIGLSNSDLTQFLAQMILLQGDLSAFPALPDRMQQGFLNTLYLARALAHEDGFASLPEFQKDGEPVFDVNQADPAADMGYYGGSLGGIGGAATTALAPDWERAGLGVPGVGFTTMLSRSTQFNAFLPFIYSSYPNGLERQLGIAMLQVLWDRGEPAAYTQSITDGSLGTPPHKVLIQESFGDYQVANITTQTLARAVGATLRAPALTPGRIDDLSTIPDPSGEYLFTPMDRVEPYWGLPTATSAQLNQPGGLPDTSALMIVTDTGEIRPRSGPGSNFYGTNANPDWNIAPVAGTSTVENDGSDPHGPGATSPAALQTLVAFLESGGFFDPCGNGETDPLSLPPYTVPFSSADPQPCVSPPDGITGNGR